MDHFRGRKLVIATKHQKHVVIAPILEKVLGVQCFTAADFDTDLFGTFSGEPPRKLPALDTARAKCQMAMEHANCDLGLSSEGSFGPHPALFFIPADEELLFFKDNKIGLEIWVREISAETNFAAQLVHSKEELERFARKAKFPEHGLILRPSEASPADIIKGIRDWANLRKAFLKVSSNNGSAFAETDMRAMHNPTRMKVIEKCCKKLAKKIACCCPICRQPGFAITSVHAGLPCAHCGLPTRSILSHQYVCQKCSYTYQKMYPNIKTVEDPQFCDYCNP